MQEVFLRLTRMRFVQLHVHEESACSAGLKIVRTILIREFGFRTPVTR